MYLLAGVSHWSEVVEANLWEEDNMQGSHPSRMDPGPSPGGP